jgi:hypothetical protein
MTDIDRAVEIATHLDFIAFTEGHPYPTDYESETIIYCHVCGDEPVERKGRACDYCVASDDDEMRDMAARANAFLPTPAEARTMARLSEVAHG